MCVNHQPNVKVAPKTHPRSVRSKALTWVIENKATAAPGRVAKVVANNGWVRLGVPLTVTVGTRPAGEGGETEGVADAARILNWLDVPAISPMVELMKMRK